MNVVDEKSLGRVLQAARQKVGLTQQAMCQRAGLSYSTLAKIERGAIKAPSIFTIRQIADVLGLTLDQLVGEATGGVATSKKMKTKGGISFIYFDINGCLVRFFHRAFTAIAKDTGLSPDTIETAFWHFNDAVCKGHMDRKAFNIAFAKQLGIESIDWQTYYLNAVIPIPEMHDVIRWAATRYKIGLMSNIGEGFIDDLRAKKLIPDLAYDAIIDSSAVGVIKPDTKIYQIAQAKAGVPSTEILLIDDSRANLIPAQQLGWHVMWFNDYDSVDSSEQVRAALEPAN